MRDYSKQEAIDEEKKETQDEINHLKKMLQYVPGMKEREPMQDPGYR